MKEKKFRWKDLFGLLKETYQEWNDNDPWRMSAAMSYYAIFSLPGLLMIVITVAGWAFGEEAVRGELSGQIGEMIGPSAAESIETIISYTEEEESGGYSWGAIIGIATLIFGSTAVFYQLQKSLNEIWDVELKNEGVKRLIFDRATSFGVILMVGFLLLISLVLTTALSALSDYIMQYLPSFLFYVFAVLEFLLSFVLITLLFGMIYKILPDVEMMWRTVWIGAAVTAVLFVIGKFAMGVYFGTSDPGSAYGAAGSLILILLWVSYSCLILFFGAAFTQVFARKYGHRIVPSPHARYTASYLVDHPEMLKVRAGK